MKILPFTELQKIKNCFNDDNEFPQVLYFGDSVVERISRDDLNRSTLGELVSEYLKGIPTCCISHSAYNPKIYYYLLSSIEKMKRYPKIIILPINLRCFSPQWDLNPKWQFGNEIGIIKAFLKNPAREICGLPEEEEKAPSLMNAFYSIPVTYPETSFKKIGQFQKIIETSPTTEDERVFRLKQIFIFHYMHALVPDHPKLTYLSNTLDLLMKMGIHAVIYVTPINYQAGLKYAGDVFLDKIKANSLTIYNTLESRLESPNLSYNDFSQIFTSEKFFNMDCATEHLNENGRMELARMIANDVLKMHAAMGD